jgi:hypothetical protein
MRLENKVIFVILPYLKTAKPVNIRGITFRSSNDLDGLSTEDQRHLKNLFAMFFLRNSLRITEMTYALLQLEDDQGKNEDLIDRMSQAQALIAYRYSYPHHIDGRPFLPLEYSSVYLFQAAPVSEFLVWPEDRVENMTGENPTEAHRKGHWLDGYDGLLNWTYDLWVVPGVAIYPTIPNLLLNLPQQDLAANLYQSEFDRHSWAMIDLVGGRRLTVPKAESRIFNAIEWHNRSASAVVSEDIALMNLAIAIESLLNLEQGDESRKFKEAIQTLLGTVLGSIPYLESWLDQFYKARSKIVHEGNWPHLMFYAVDTKRFSKIVREDEPHMPFRSLTAYGRHIFRLCLNTLLTGAVMTEDVGLSGLLVHNQERLQSICKRLNDPGATPQERILSISREVRDVKQYWVESRGHVETDTVLGAGKRVLQVYLETNPDIPVELAQIMKSAIEIASDVGLREKLDCFEEVVEYIRAWKGDAQTRGGSGLDESFEVMRALLEHVVHPEFTLRALEEEQRTKKAGRSDSQASGIRSSESSARSGKKQESDK